MVHRIASSADIKMKQEGLAGTVLLISFAILFFAKSGNRRMERVL